MLKAYSTLALIACCTLAAQAAPVVIPLTGTNAGETSGDGWAFRIPNLDGIPGGGFNSIDIAPLNPFDIGTITYDSTTLTGVGVEYVSVTPDMVSLNLDEYATLAANELAVIGEGGATIVLTNITGRGLTFLNGQVARVDFTADVDWTPTLNGFATTFEPYIGTLTVSGGSFTFDMSDNANSWFIGATDVDFIFDLTGTFLDPLPSPLPVVTIAIEGGSLSADVTFPTDTWGQFVLEKSDDLESWPGIVVATFDQANPPGELPLTSEPNTTTFYRIGPASE